MRVRLRTGTDLTPLGFQTGSGSEWTHQRWPGSFDRGWAEGLYRCRRGAELELSPLNFPRGPDMQHYLHWLVQLEPLVPGPLVPELSLDVSAVAVRPGPTLVEPTLGFELETQATHAVTSDMYHGDVAEQLEDACRVDLRRAETTAAARAFRRLADDNGLLAQLFGGVVGFTTLAEVARQRAGWRPSLSSADWVGGLLPPELPLEVVTDGSVAGFEFRTIGGLDRAGIDRCVRAVYGLDHAIDGRCSFHVHAGLPGVALPEHWRWRAVAKLELLAYLLSQWDRLPAPVRSRLRQLAWRERYASLLPIDAKHTSVHFHPQGTIEFRLFGGIATVADALRCLELAREATTHLQLWMRRPNQGFLRDFATDSITEASLRLAGFVFTATTNLAEARERCALSSLLTEQLTSEIQRLSTSALSTTAA